MSRDGGEEFGRSHYSSNPSFYPLKECVCLVWIQDNTGWIRGTAPCIDPRLLLVGEPEPLIVIIIQRTALEIRGGIGKLPFDVRGRVPRSSECFWDVVFVEWRNGETYIDLPWLHDGILDGV